jgi:hypothetical protein
LTKSVAWYQRTAIWLGVAINPASITLGGGLAVLLPLTTLLWVMPFGALLLSGLATAQAITARRQHKSFSQLAIDAFGAGWGSRLLNVLMALGMIGWGGFHVGVSGSSAGILLHLPGWVGTLLIVAIAFTLTEMGVSRWNALLWLTTLSALALAIFSLKIIGVKPDFSATPHPIPLAQILWAIGTVVTFGILFATRTPDFSWDVAKDADILKNGVAYFTAYIVSMFVGALLFQATGDWNLADILAKAEAATLGQLFLIVAVASPILSGLLSGTLALQAVTGWQKRVSTALICGVVFLLGAFRFDRQLLPFLDILSVLIPPALFVMLAGSFRKQMPPTAQAVVAWLVGAGVALLFKLQGGQVHMPVGASVAILTLWLVPRFMPST